MPEIVRDMSEHARIGSNSRSSGERKVQTIEDNAVRHDQAEGRRFPGMMANDCNRKRHHRLPPATIRHPGCLAAE
jgi:hypothetical protein